MSTIWHYSLLAMWLSLGSAVAAGVNTSKHNLSATGRGRFTASVAAGGAGSEICLFCHTPHTAGKRALWNREDSGVTYTPYQSSTAKARVGQPTGASKLCLSCHDGTVALGRVRNRASPLPLKSARPTMPVGPNNLGTDLSDDHPISFRYDQSLVAANGHLNHPSGSTHIRLDGSGELQCTSCHDPHNDQNEKFLVMNNRGTALCTSCHNIPGWRQSSHSLSSKTWNGNTPDPWPHTADASVAANGCENCHDPHGAEGRQRLLNYAAEEENCFACHNGNVASGNVQAEFSKTSVHPVINTTGVHDPMEKTLLSSGAGRHVECQDCHNPHATSAGGAAPGTVSGALAGVRGINLNGADVSQITHEYELCFRCHSDGAKGPSRVSRQYPQLNTRLEFQTSGGTNSYHPVLGLGRNPNVPSLKAPWTTASLISCSDCHNSDSGPKNGGTGPNGPHGSIYPPLLERPLNLLDGAANAANSALCFKCHNFVNTTWTQHVRHMGMTSCMTCHDPHGSPNAHLINFNPSIVTGARSYRSLGLNRASCVLSCHGKEHNETY